MKVSVDQAHTGMPVEVSICAGGDTQSWWVSAPDKQARYRGRSNDNNRGKNCFYKDLCRRGLLSLFSRYFCLSDFYLNMWITHPFLCMQISTCRSKTICVWSLNSGRWKAQTICRVQIWAWSATVQENGDTSSPGFAEVLYFNSVSLPTLLQAKFTPLLSPKRKGNSGDKDVPRGVTNLYPSGVLKDSHLY